MVKRIIAACLTIAVVLSMCACSNKHKTLAEVLSEDPGALSVVRRDQSEVVCKDYTVYNTGGGIVDNINATRYSIGLVETQDRFVDYQYVVEDNKTGWLYIFESIDDIYSWMNQN